MWLRAIAVAGVRRDLKSLRKVLKRGVAGKDTQVRPAACVNGAACCAVLSRLTLGACCCKQASDSDSDDGADTKVTAQSVNDHFKTLTNPDSYSDTANPKLRRQQTAPSRVGLGTSTKPAAIPEEGDGVVESKSSGEAPAEMTPEEETEEKVCSRAQCRMAMRGKRRP